MRRYVNNGDYIKRKPRFVPRVGLPRNLFLTGSLTAALRFSKGWVRKDANLGLRTGCTKQWRLYQTEARPSSRHTKLIIGVRLPGEARGEIRSIVISQEMYSIINIIICLHIVQVDIRHSGVQWEVGAVDEGSIIQSTSL